MYGFIDNNPALLLFFGKKNNVQHDIVVFIIKKIRYLASINISS